MPVARSHRPKGVPRSWPAMDDIRKEPCSLCGQMVHERSCLAEMTVRMHYAEQMAKAATQQAEDAVMRFDECNTANVLLQARMEEQGGAFEEFRLDFASLQASHEAQAGTIAVLRTIADWAAEHGYVDPSLAQAQAEADAIAHAEIVVVTTNEGEEG